MKSELPILKINSKNKFSGKFYRFSMATQSSLVKDKSRCTVKSQISCNLVY